LDQARKSGQQLGPAASEGTFAAGVNHVTELLPSFMKDIIVAAPEDQKVRHLDTESEATSPHRIYVYMLGDESRAIFPRLFAQTSRRWETRRTVRAVFSVFCICALKLTYSYHRPRSKS
jgi:hypothetical protein